MPQKSDQDCIEAYERFGHLGQAAADLGIAKATLHGRLVRLGVSTSRARKWGVHDDDVLRANYQSYRRAGKTRDLARMLDRTTGAVATRAYSLGLTDASLTEADVVVADREAFRRSSEDRYRAMELLRGVGGADHLVRCVVLDGDPMSKARSRFTRRGGTYTPASVREAEKRWMLRLEGSEQFTGNVALAAIFVRADAQRIDVDNMLKLVMDACTAAGVWMDDSQVTGIVGVVECDPYEPRTILALGPHSSTMLRGTDHWPRCPVCGEAFNPSGRAKPVFCSKECRAGRQPSLLA